MFHNTLHEKVTDIFCGDTKRGWMCWVCVCIWGVRGNARSVRAQFLQNTMPEIVLEIGSRKSTQLSTPIYYRKVSIVSSPRIRISRPSSAYIRGALIIR